MPINKREIAVLYTVGELRRFLASFDDDCPCPVSISYCIDMETAEGSLVVADPTPYQIPHPAANQQN